jgi:hypothetical protein
MKKWIHHLSLTALISLLLLSACSALPETSIAKAIEPVTDSPEITSPPPTELPAEPSPASPAIETLPVAGWLGKVVSAPEGVGYEDILVLSPETVGELGIMGADENMETQILALRDKPEPGQYAHFWGNLVCGVEDHNGCQIVVERIRVGATATDPEPVENWQGILIPAEFNSGDSTLFVLKGSYAMWYSIHSNDPALLQQILDLRGTDQVVTVSGELLTGVPDVNGSRIQASQISLTGETQAAEAAQPAAFDPRADWQTYPSPAGDYQFKFPPTAEIIPHGIEGFPTEDMPTGMPPDQYMVQLRQQYPYPLCVEVRYALGYLTINSAANADFKYTPCGRTGVGAGELQQKTETITIAKKEYTAEGFEFLGGGESLDLHNETFHILLENGLRLEYGSIPRTDATYQDYLMKGKPMVLEILAGMEIGP